MSNFKVIFTLKQHTPIIHFQSFQSGATLRASELKPKFDKFLLEQVSNLPVKINANGHRSLDYKVKIESNGIKQEYLYKTYIIKTERGNKKLKEGSYFGDFKAIQYDNIKIEFFSFDTSILNAIKEHFIDFINITNFGARQNKGFGSFEVIKKDNKPINNDIKNSILKYYPAIYTKHSKDPLKTILEDYQLLKSGKSNPTYKKSLLFQYMCDNEIRWEKRMIKHYMKKDYKDTFAQLKYEKEPITCDNENDNYTFQYIRGLLGIAEQIEFLKVAPVNHKDKIVIKIKSSNDIERFQSPITYKVIDNTIYLLATNNISVRGKKFEFSIKGKENTNKKGILNEAIEIPQEFDIFEFLDFANNTLKYTKVTQ